MISFCFSETAFMLCFLSLRLTQLSFYAMLDTLVQNAFALSIPHPPLTEPTFCAVFLLFSKSLHVMLSFSVSDTAWIVCHISLSLWNAFILCSISVSRTQPSFWNCSKCFHATYSFSLLEQLSCYGISLCFMRHTLFYALLLRVRYSFRFTLCPFLFEMNATCYALFLCVWHSLHGMPFGLSFWTTCNLVPYILTCKMLAFYAFFSLSPICWCSHTWARHRDISTLCWTAVKLRFFSLSLYVICWCLVTMGLFRVTIFSSVTLFSPCFALDHLAFRVARR